MPSPRPRRPAQGRPCRARAARRECPWRRTDGLTRCPDDARHRAGVQRVPTPRIDGPTPAYRRYAGGAGRELELLEFRILHRARRVSSVDTPPSSRAACPRPASAQHRHVAASSTSLPDQARARGLRASARRRVGQPRYARLPESSAPRQRGPCTHCPWLPRCGANVRQLEASS